MKPVKPPLMPHEERLRLIRTPITTRVIGGGRKSWSGRHVSEFVPTEGRRCFVHVPFDDEMYHNHGGQD